MKTFDCPKCGAPVTYEPNALASGTARCSYCQSQLALPDELRGKPAHVISQVDVNVERLVKETASKAIWFLVLIPVFIVAIALAGVLGALGPILRKVSPPRIPSATPAGPSGSRTTDPANSFARVVLTFGSEGIGPGMMIGARSIAVDAAGRIYVGEYSSGRVQVFDPAGQFVTQWLVDPKMPLRGMAVDRRGTVYIAQRGIITRYEGETGKSLGQIEYSEGNGFNDIVTTPDGGLLCSWYSNRDDIVRFNAQGEVVSTIPKAISTVADRPELDTSVAIDGLGNIYALGSFTDGIFKFSSNGKFLNRFGGPGSEPGQIRASHAIAVDGKGRVFVSDTKGVQVFDSDGRYLTVFKPGGVAFGMTFNDKNELFIATGNKVTKFVVNQ